MKMLITATILAAFALPAAAQSTAKVEPQSTSAPSVAPAKSDAKASSKSGSKSAHAHHTGAHKSHKKKPAAESTAGKG
jgi:hypothetical protein